MHETGDRINILYVSHYGHYRMGGQKSMLTLIEKLDRRIFRPFAVVPGKGELYDKLERLDCPCALIEMKNLKFKNFLKICRAKKKLEQVVKKWNIHIIHSDQDHDTVVCGFAKKKAKLIWHIRLTRPYKWDRINRKRADGIISVADDALQSRLGDASDILQKSRTIYNGVDCGVFQPVASQKELREKLGLPLDKFVLLFVGQIKRGKGIFDLAEAVALLKESRHADALPRVVYIGTPSKDKVLLELGTFITDHGLEGHLEIVAQQQNIHEWMQASDALILPSHERVEGMGRVLYEAMACGTAVITTDVAGNREALTPETGLLVPEKTPDEIARAIGRLVDDRELLHAFQQAGRERARTHFNIDRNIKAVENLYTETTGPLHA